jgi:hypothetical protein
VWVVVPAAQCWADLTRALARPIRSLMYTFNTTTGLSSGYIVVPRVSLTRLSWTIMWTRPLCMQSCMRIRGAPPRGQRGAPVRSTRATHASQAKPRHTTSQHPRPQCACWVYSLGAGAGCVAAPAATARALQDPTLANHTQESGSAVLAEVGTFIMEFGTLARDTGAAAACCRASCDPSRPCHWVSFDGLDQHGRAPGGVAHTQGCRFNAGTPHEGRGGAWAPTPVPSSDEPPSCVAPVAWDIPFTPYSPRSPPPTDMLAWRPHS